MQFPSIRPPVYPIKETIPDTAIKGELENQTILTRKRFTRTPRTFELTWSALPQKEYRLLKSFYETVNGALPFSWVHPIDGGAPLMVRFSGNFEFTSVNPKYWEGTITLVEV